MLTHEQTIYRAMPDLLRRMLDDVAEEEMALQPSPGMNPPRWIVGHLAVTTDFALQLLGQEAVFSPGWHKAFDPGSDSADPNCPRLTKDELLEALTDGKERVLTAIEQHDGTGLDQPHGVTFASLDRGFPTCGDLLAFVMTGHEWFHLGQLSAWRRATGRKPMF